MTKRIAFLITHGTDTMAWGLSYLEHALKMCPAPVAFVGSQIPMTERFSASDAYANIDLALKTLLELRDPFVLVAFNHGRTLYSRNLWKKDKWDIDAFTGRVVGRHDSNRFIYQESVRRHPERIDVLYVVRTGGTIEADFVSEKGDVLGHAATGEDPVVPYLQSTYVEKKRAVGRVVDIKVCGRDSSDLTLDEWGEVAVRIAEVCREHGYRTTADVSFAPNVPLVFCSPFCTTQQYAAMLAGSPGAVLVGYGAGNVNIRIDSERSPIPALEKYRAEGGFVVLCSHVQDGIVDSVYENGAEIVRRGLAVPGADLSIATAQMRLSYILGHEEELREGSRTLATKLSIDEDAARRKLLAVLFLSGAEFAGEESRRAYMEALEIRPPKEDLLARWPFPDSLRSAIDHSLEAPKRRFAVVSTREEWPSPSQGERCAFIVKPDFTVGENRWGEDLDASRNIVALIEACFEWGTFTIEPSALQGFSSPEGVLPALSTGAVLFWEGGRPSVHRPETFTTLPRQFLLDLVSAAIGRRARSADWPPSIFICLSHQLVGQALYDMVLRLPSSGVGSRLRGEAGGGWNEFTDTLRALHAECRLGPHAVGRGTPETGILRLAPYAPPRGRYPKALVDAHERIARLYSGGIEDLLPVDSLDLPMLHSDEVQEGHMLFVNWALSRLHELKRRYTEIRSLDRLEEYPIGLEITSSTNDGESARATEVASMCIYYEDSDGVSGRDFSFQFHPELIGERKLDLAVSSREMELSFRNDGVKLLVGAILGARERRSRE